jgi:SET domain-containing protein
MVSKVVARKSGLHGRGLFAACDLEAGEALIEYKGTRYGKGEVPDLGDDGITRFLRLSDGSGIDGTGWASLANHGCDPNCELMEEEGSHPPRAWLYTLKEVKKGEELVWDYRLDVASSSEAYEDWACACGSEECRGTMADPELLRAASGKPKRGHRPGRSR